VEVDVMIRKKGEKVYGKRVEINQEEKDHLDKWVDAIMIFDFLDYTPDQVLTSVTLLNDVVLEMNNTNAPEIDSPEEVIDLAYKTFGRSRS